MDAAANLHTYGAPWEPRAGRLRSDAFGAHELRLGKRPLHLGEEVSSLEYRVDENRGSAISVLIGARWITERATAEGRTEADVVAEALAVRWGAQLGDAYRDVWDASERIDQAEAGKLVDDEVYRPRQERRRAG